MSQFNFGRLFPAPVPADFDATMREVKRRARRRQTLRSAVSSVAAGVTLGLALLVPEPRTSVAVPAQHEVHGEQCLPYLCGAFTAADGRTMCDERDVACFDHG